MEFDKEGNYWSEPEFENIYGYKKPKRKSEEGPGHFLNTDNYTQIFNSKVRDKPKAKAYQLLARIERESDPSQIEERRKEELYRQSYTDKLNDVKR